MATTSGTTTSAAIGPTHPLYTTYERIWRQLADVAEGAGGFLDGGYLIAHPREWEDHTAAVPRVPSKKLRERRALARYENIAALILTQKLSALFRQPPTRRILDAAGAVVEEHDYLTWTENVDGSGKSLDQWLRTAFHQALIFGHEVLVMDRAGDDGTTAADKKPLVLRAYTPLDMPDWLTDPNGHLTAVKLIECVQRETLADSPAMAAASYLVREITATGAAQYKTGGSDGSERTEVAHQFGALPVVLLYAHRRAVTPIIGVSALADPMLYVDLFNLASEIRELLRKQTFSLVNIPLGAASDGQGPALSVESAQAMLGQTTGTTNVLFSALPAQYISADTSNVTVYLAVCEQLIRTILRLCSVPYEQDSRDAESAEARQAKRVDFNTCLAGYADELQQAELALARLWYRGTYGEQWEAQWDKAQPEVNYPQSFDETPFSEILEQAMAAQALPLGESVTFRTEHNMRLLGSFLPDAPQDTVDAIRAELDALPTPEEEREQRLEEVAMKLTAAPGAKPGGDKAKPPPKAA